jgi:hypothetical protein
VVVVEGSGAGDEGGEVVGGLGELDGGAVTVVVVVLSPTADEPAAVISARSSAPHAAVNATRTTTTTVDPRPSAWFRTLLAARFKPAPTTARAFVTSTAVSF